MMPPMPTKEQVQELRNLIANAIEIKRMKRKGIALRAKAEMGEIDIELAQLENQKQAFEQAQKVMGSQNGPSLVVPSGGGRLV